MAGRVLLFVLVGFGLATIPLHTKKPSYHAVSKRLRTQDLLSCVEEAKEFVDTAYRFTQENLREKLRKTSMDPAAMLMTFKQPVGEARRAVKSAEYLHVTLDVLKEKLQGVIPGNFNVTDVLTPAQMHTIYKATGCAKQEMMKTECNDLSPYRTITGECNNKRIPTLGSSSRPYARWLPQEYEDGISLPRGWEDGKLYFGFPLPLVRNVSNEIVRFPNNNLTEDRFRSVMFMQWGQFIDHDLDFGPSTTATLTFMKGVDCDKSCEKGPPCFPIKIPPNDPVKSPRDCIPFTRSAPACNGGYAIRNQINALTPFIDASMVYASEDKWAQQLRNPSSPALLAVNQRFTDRGFSYLPFGVPEGFPDICNLTNKQLNIPCFFAGDNRVNEMPALTVLHTLLLREHNRLVRELKRLNPQMDAETLYQESRQIIGALIEKITFQEYLPALLGFPMPRYRGYNDSTDPRVASVFTNVFRFGHAAVRPTVFRLDSRYQLQSETPLEQEFFATWRIIKEGGIDPIIRGLLTKPAKRLTQNQFVVDALRDKLFEQVSRIGLDLPALNMQRGRDHGLPGYNAWRRFCGLSEARNEAELTTILRNPTLARKLIQLYGTPNNIDIWIGGLSEPLFPNARVGPLFSCIIKIQFLNIRAGDRFWWENPGVFTLAQRIALNLYTLPRVICDNTHLREVPYFVFKVNRYPQDFVSCDKIPRLSLFPWRRP